MLETERSKPKLPHNKLSGLDGKNNKTVTTQRLSINSDLV